MRFFGVCLFQDAPCKSLQTSIESIIINDAIKNERLLPFDATAVAVAISTHKELPSHMHARTHTQDRVMA